MERSVLLMQKQGKVSPQRWRLLRDKNVYYRREHDSYAYEKLLFLVSSMVMEIGEKGKGGKFRGMCNY